jgi:Lipase (class 3)
VTAFADERIMLTLAALTYRGFHDPLRGRMHEEAVTSALLDGLQTLAPVKNEWDLVWGPATGREPGQIVDSNAMYVARSRRAPQRLVVAIRGTNPVSVSDWVFGDFGVGETVDWPYATAADPAAVSKSTALGLAALQAMRSHAPAPRSTSDVAAFVARTFATVERAVREGPRNLLAATPAWFESQVRKIAERLQSAATRAESLTDQRRAAAAAPVAPSDLRHKLGAEPGPEADRDLLALLRSEAGQGGAPLEVVVTGHSKGGALAQAVAVWLKDSLDSPDPQECWDPTRRARIECYAFAGPTPGNAGFARRVEQKLGPHYHHFRNMNDIVTHAWQVDELRAIPALYGDRSAAFKKLVGIISNEVERHGYRQATLGVTRFSGALDTKRSFASEFVYQHLDAYLAEVGLHAEGVRAINFFI